MQVNMFYIYAKASEFYLCAIEELRPGMIVLLRVVSSYGVSSLNIVVSPYLYAGEDLRATAGVGSESICECLVLHNAECDVVITTTVLTSTGQKKIMYNRNTKVPVRTWR